MKRNLYFLLLLLIFVIFQLVIGSFFFCETIVVLFYIMLNLCNWNLRFDFRNLISPQNFAFSIFFVKLYIIPCISIFFGYYSYYSNTNILCNSEIVIGYLVTFISYISFVVGWTIFCNRKKSCHLPDANLNIYKLRKISLFFFLGSIVPLLLSFNGIDDFLKQIYVNDSDLNSSYNPFLKFLLILSKSFLPFSFMLYFSTIKIESFSRYKKFVYLIIFSVLLLLSTLGTNRQSMVYILLAFWGGYILCKNIKVSKLSFFLVAFSSIYILYMFSFLRSSKVSENNNYEFSFNEFTNTVQIYFGGPSTFTPILKAEKDYGFTLVESFFQNFPVLGKVISPYPLGRYYNRLIYNSDEIYDQILYTHIELYYNGGFLMVFVFFLFIGYYYAFFNKIFFLSKSRQLILSMSVLYLSLLFNGFIFLGIGIVGQFLWYASPPALIILLVYRHASKK